MDTVCPWCHQGIIAEVADPASGIREIRCSEYPRCRFKARAWSTVNRAAARHHGPVQPGSG